MGQYGMTFTVILENQIDQRYFNWLDGVRITFEGDQTVLTGEIPDQAALFGLINRIRDMGITIISIEAK